MNQRSFFDYDAQDYLDELKKEWRNTIGGAGGLCKCCGKFGKIHEMKLSQHLALCLRWMKMHAEEDGWVNVQSTAPRWMLRGKTYPCLAYWFLVESKGHRSGIWRVSDKGHRFLNEEITQPEFAFVYNNQVLEYSTEEVTFQGCFGNHFDFQEMMDSRFDWNKVVGKTKKNAQGELQ